MTNSINKPEIETLSYKPKAENKESVHPEDCQCLKCSPEPNWKQCHNTMTSRECINCEIDAAGKCHLPPEPPICGPKPEQSSKGVAFRPACVTCKNMVDEGGAAACDIGGCDKTTEQPNQQIMLVKTIQNLATCMLNSISKLPESTLKDQAYDDMNIFETGILFKLQKEYE